MRISSSAHKPNRVATTAAGEHAVAPPITLSERSSTGLALGVLWWLLFEVVLANITNHAPSPLGLSFGQFLSSFPLAVLFGVLLGAIFIQWQGQHEPHQPS